MCHSSEDLQRMLYSAKESLAQSPGGDLVLSLLLSRIIDPRRKTTLEEARITIASFEHEGILVVFYGW